MKAINAWRPAAFFWLNLFYIGVLVILLVSRPAHWLQVDRISDPIGGLVPMGVPWFGALGAVVISTYGVFDHNHEWDSRWNYWHAARPFVGAILGTVAFLIFVGLINATGADPVLVPDTSEPPSTRIAYLVLAFVVGFREETFRMLIKRAVDILLGPGIPGETAQSVGFTTATPKIVGLQTGQPSTVDLTLSNFGTGMISVNSGSVQPPGSEITVTQGTATNLTVVGLDGITVEPSAHKSGQLTVTPTAAGDLAVQVTINGSFGSRILTVKGTAT